MLFQSRLRMMAMISPVTYVCPALIDDGGCSEALLLGMIQETAGSVPREAALKNPFRDWMFRLWPSCAGSARRAAPRRC